MDAQLYEAIKDTADKINKADEFYGELALRKVAAVSENSDLATLMQVAEDLELIASKVTA